MKKLKKRSKTSVPESDEEMFTWDFETSTTTQMTQSKSKTSGKFSGLLKKRASSKSDPPQDADEATISGRNIRGGKRAITVVLHTNQSELNVSDMLMEVIASRNIINEDKTPEDWSRLLHSVGQIPFYLLAGDPDRYHMCIYAAEFLRRNPEFKDVGISELSVRQPEANRHRVFGENEVQTEIEGHSWGGEDEDVTVREQMKAKAQSQIDSNRAKAVPAEASVSSVAQHDAYLAKWVQAEKWANTPRSEWVDKVDPEFEAMIKYCYGWLRDIGEVPQPYPSDLLDLFWQRPLPDSVPMDEQTVERRSQISGKVMKFWAKSMKKYKDQVEFRKPMSYRVVLAAQRLSKSIEKYAVNWQFDSKNDEALIERIKRNALKYLEAHIPLDTGVGKGGPLKTYDPDYVEYVQICRKYNLKEGCILHEELFL